jgi:hypothetical protein
MPAELHAAGASLARALPLSGWPAGTKAAAAASMRTAEADPAFPCFGFGLIRRPASAASAAAENLVMDRFALDVERFVLFQGHQ